MRSFVLATSLAAFSLTVGAAELGSLSLVSRLGEPFDARLDLRDVQPGENVEISLGTASLYEKAGRKLTPEVTTFQIAPQKDAKGRFRIRSTQALNVESFPLILVMKADSKVKAKVYNIKLAPPRSISRNTPSKPPVIVEHKENKQALAVKVPKKAATERAESVKSHPKTSSAVTKVESGTKAKKTARVKTSVVPVKKPSQMTLPEKLHAPIYVDKGMTLWSIAGKVHAMYPQASIDRIQVALVRANPQAFKNGRVTGLRLGSRLRIPSAELINSITEQEAWAVVRVRPAMNALKAPSAKRLATAKKRMPASRLTTQKVSAPIIQKAAVNTVQTPETTTLRTEDAAPKHVAPIPSEESAAVPQKTVMPKDSHETTGVQKESGEPSGTQTQEPFAENKVAAEPETKVETPPESKPVENKDVAPKPEKSGMPWGVLFGSLVAAFAALGGFFVWRRRREKANEESFESPSESPVRFCEKQPETSPEQLKEIENTVTRRLESDERAEQGFELKGETLSQATPLSQPSSENRETKAPVNNDTSAVIVSQVPVAENEQTETNDTNAENDKTDLSESEKIVEVQNVSVPEPITGRIEPTLGIDFGQARSEMPSQESSEVGPAESKESTTDQTLDQKLVQARTLLESSLSNRAIELLEEIALKGDEKQRAAALKLLTEKQP